MAVKETRPKTVSYLGVQHEVYEVRVQHALGLRMVVSTNLETNKLTIKVIKGDGRLKEGFFLYAITKDATHREMIEMRSNLVNGEFDNATPIDRTLGH